MANINNRDDQMTRHHIIPTSRRGKDGDNVTLVPRREHQLYHALFSNMTPDEIIHYLVKVFWNGQYDWLDVLKPPIKEGE